MQQVFAQLAVEIHKAEGWWLTDQEERWLEEHNRDHRSVSAIRERVLAVLDLDRINEVGLDAMSSTEVLRKIDIDNPTNPQHKDCCGVLREYLGEPKRIRGTNKWRVPLRGGKNFPSLVSPDDDY